MLDDSVVSESPLETSRSKCRQAFWTRLSSFVERLDPTDPHSSARKVWRTAQTMKLEDWFASWLVGYTQRPVGLQVPLASAPSVTLLLLLNCSDTLSLARPCGQAEAASPLSETS
jgi:hypothetical protein